MSAKEPKLRLDTLLVERGLASSRQKAQALILAGQVLVQDTPADKVGSKFPQSVAIRLRGERSPYVGRGGEKIAPALDSFKVQLNGIVAIDVGASTGGFTDCMLQRGAKKVYAVDVGYNQLDFSIRQDERVVVMERTNARNLDGDLFAESPSFATIDLSFISVKKILPALMNVLDDSAELVVLVKPQFELQPQEVGTGGVVKDPALHQKAISQVSESAAEFGLEQVSVFASTLRGLKKGNQEYFVYFRHKRPESEKK